MSDKSSVSGYIKRLTSQDWPFLKLSGKFVIQYWYVQIVHNLIDQLEGKISVRKVAYCVVCCQFLAFEALSQQLFSLASHREICSLT